MGTSAISFSASCCEVWIRAGGIRGGQCIPFSQANVTCMAYGMQCEYNLAVPLVEVELILVFRVGKLLQERADGVRSCWVLQNSRILHTLFRQEKKEKGRQGFVVNPAVLHWAWERHFAKVVEFQRWPCCSFRIMFCGLQTVF